MLIDTHAHVNFNAFREDSDEVVKRALENDIWMVMPGSQYSTSRRAVEMAGRHERGVYAAVGLHPIHLGQRRVGVQETQSEVKPENDWEAFETRAEEFDCEAYKSLAKNSNRVVAIGEFGLDYYYRPKGKARLEEFKKKQKEVFAQQLQLAKELRLPVLLHCRVAHDDMIEALPEKVEGVVHCFTGNLEQAEKFLQKGLFLGLNGLIFKDVVALPNPTEIIAAFPLDRILLETDSPYLVPPVAGKERNEPLFVTYIAEEIARIKKITREEVAEATTKNAKALFGI